MVKRYLKDLVEKTKKHLNEVIKIKKEPHAIASGFAIGTFIAILPTFGFGILIGLFVILIFKRISKLAMLAAFAVWNPLILTLMYPMDYYVGELLIINEPVYSYKLEIFNQLFIYSRRFMIGSIVIGITFALLSYLIVLILLLRFYEKENLKKILKEELIR